MMARRRLSIWKAKVLFRYWRYWTHFWLNRKDQTAATICWTRAINWWDYAWINFDESVRLETD